MITKNKAVLYLSSQPPTMAEFVALLNCMEHFDKVALLLGRSEVMSEETAMFIWEKIIQHLTQSNKIETIEIWKANPYTQVALPSKYKNYIFCTTDARLYSHFASLSVPSKIVPKLDGYEDVFAKVMYRQSLAFSYIRKNYM